jgi:acyl-[acyl-carrier-protein]-phospholipid O-acyltransferase/long-chain-fatty-acid--[acyl-carrier-protein] ligase
MIKSFFRLLVRLLYRFRDFNSGVLNTPGPVLLVPNHVSWLDWLFLVLCLDEDWKFVVSRSSADTSWLHRRIMLNRRTFPIDTTSPYAVKRMAEHLTANGRLVLFAEGRISRTGTLMKLFDGTGFLLHKVGAKVITCYLRGAFRLPFSPNQNAKRWFPRVTAHFSDVLTPPHLEHVSTLQARVKLTNWLREQMVLQQFHVEMEFGPTTVHGAILETAVDRPRPVLLQDFAAQLSGRRLLVATRLFGRALGARLAPSPERVGVLLPNVIALPVTLLALWSAGRVPAILNYSTGPASMLACSQLAGFKQIITSRAFLEKAKLNVQPLSEFEFIYVEDLRATISKFSRVRALLQTFVDPRSMVRTGTRIPEPGSRNPKLETPHSALRTPHLSASAVILFTSGSEGAPKGVELTHYNLLANVRQMLAVTDMQDTDRIFNALPLFHSFGLTVGTLFPLMRGMYCFLYPSPLHYRVVPTIFYFADCTVMLGTNTFLNGYARKAHPYEFRSLRYMFAGAEKLQEATAATWAQRFGVRVLEGYGATECGPCVSVNVPMAPRYGSAGQLMPGMEWRIEKVEGVTDGGRLHVRGPNIMRGYLNADANAKFQALGGWYDTGDIVRVDDDRFVTILGRLKRFAKISGEMVSLTAVEDALAGAFPQYGLRCQVAIVARPDENKGEMLVAIANEPRLKLDEIRAVLRAKGLPNLCVPRDVKYVREIPKLGTGKVNHRELEKMI